MARPRRHPRLETLRRRQETGAHREKHLVVRRDSLHRPEVLRVDLFRVVERAEGPGTDALHVPRVEELVREEEERVPVRLLRAERPRVESHRLRGAVLEAAARARREVDEEEIALVRNSPEERRRLLDELPQVADEPGGLLVALAPDRERVGDASHAEVDRAVRPALERRVHELVVALGAEDAASRGQCHGGLPALRETERDLLRLVLAALDVEEQKRAVAVGVRGVEVRRAHAQLVGVDAVSDEDQGRRGRGRGRFLRR